MADAVLSWQKSPSTNVESYQVQWIYNGVNAALINVPQSSGGDLSGYTADFNVGNPTITLKPGDTIGATVVAVDTVNNLRSTPDTAPTVTEPTAPPLPATGAVITLTA